jgi:membrane-associated phospholipid phosphatase
VLGRRVTGPRLQQTALVATLIAYAALTVAVVVGSPLDALDRAAASMRLAAHWPDAQPWVLRYVTLAQRAPSAIGAGLLVAWLAWRRRSWRPVILLTVSLLLLNLSVGAVKLGIGRIGPLVTTHPRAVFDGGDIFPSGHTSNAVVVFGVLAMLALRWRRAAVAAAAFGSITIGLSTVFLDTHWVTDVLGGWLAGGLVLFAGPHVSDQVERMIATIWRTASSTASATSGERGAPAVKLFASMPTTVRRSGSRSSARASSIASPTPKAWLPPEPERARSGLVPIRSTVSAPAGRPLRTASTTMTDE